jgi:inner membrane protein
MEPITHFMTGACLARAGFNRKAAYATVAMTIAAEMPDLDTLWSFDGPVAGFEHHRGITHTFLGLPFEGVAVIGAVWLLHRWRLRRADAAAIRAAAAPPHPAPATDQTIVRPLTAAPVRWGLLYGFVLIALLSHILLDWTNNYGVRPFFPFNPRWYAGSIVFIFEPVLFAVLLLALIAPALFGLISSEVGARRPAFRGRGWAIFAMLSMIGLWAWREVEHDTAIRLASTAAYGPQGSTDLSAPPVPLAPTEILRVTASPYPGNPYRWHTVVDTPAFYQMATVDSLKQTVATNPGEDLFYKPRATAATMAARRSWLGEVYLDWSSWPLVADIGPAAAINAPPGTPDWTAVNFRDLRFMYDTSLMHGRSNPPLSATVYIDAGGHVARMQMGGRVQR